MVFFNQKIIVVSASLIGIKQYVPAYLGTRLDDQDLLTGVSFASGGGGYDPLTAELVVHVKIYFRTF